MADTFDSLIAKSKAMADGTTQLRGVRAWWLPPGEPVKLSTLSTTSIPIPPEDEAGSGG